MDRRSFIAALTLSSIGILKHQNIMAQPHTKSLQRMPVLFIGHGSPMNAIEDNTFTRGWSEMVKGIPTPRAILIISAHWETQGKTLVYAGEKPKIIYDMYGFPKNLYQVNYPAGGSPELAQQIASKIQHIAPTHEWGLDHGAWSVLVKMFPNASIPCFQMSLNNTRDLQWHYDLAKELSFLRDQGVLIVGSGNIVHNLRELMKSFNQPAPDWALSFDDFVTQKINNGDHQALIDYKKFGAAATISVNSAEHYIPMLYTLALQQKGEPISYTNHHIDDTLMGISMRCFKVGA